jgi:aryl-alcohol dehydrogenase-like predicted oxidoreductase
MSDEINDCGLSRHHILTSVEKSLKRLGTDYIDLYQIHSFDPQTPAEETMRALNDLVSWGKVRYIGVSNHMAWQIIKMNWIAKKHGWASFVTMQGYYSLLGRGIEYDIVPMCKDQHMGILPWSPLAGGLLTGKYRKGKKAPENTRYSGELKGFIPADPDKLEEVLKVLDKIGAKHKVPVAAVALAWLKYKPAVSSIIIGAKNMQQLEQNIKAGELELSSEEVAELDEISREPLPYPQWMLAFTTRDRSN